MHIRPDKDGVEALRGLYVTALIADRMLNDEHAGEWRRVVHGWPQKDKNWHWPYTPVRQIRMEYELLQEEGIL